MGEQRFKVMEKKPRIKEGKKTGVDLTVADVKTGDVSKRTLLTPHGKGKKYALELKEKRHRTNAGQVKTDSKGKDIRLTDTQAAYRGGYLQAQKDAARAYNARKNGGK